MKRKKGDASAPVAPAEQKLVLTKRSIASLSEDQLSDAAGGHPNHTCEPTCPHTCCGPTCGDTCADTCGHTCRGYTCGATCGDDPNTCVFTCRDEDCGPVP